MPLGFLAQQASATIVSLSPNERNLVAFLAKLAQEGAKTGDPDYHVSLNVNLSFQRSKIDSAAAVFVSNDPLATHVSISEEDVRKSYPWDYAELSEKLSKRYIDFKLTRKYHGIRKQLLSNTMYVKTRVLDPGTPRSAKNDFYNPNVLQVFDQHYTRK